MFLLIDLQRMWVIHRHQSVEALRNLAHIELSYTATSIFEESDRANYKDFTELDLRLLYESINGSKWPYFPRDPIGEIIAVAQRIVPSDVNVFEVYLQAKTIKQDSFGWFRYVKGSNVPEQLSDLFVFRPRLAGPKVAQLPTPQPTVSAPARAPVAPPTAIPAPPKAPPKYPPPWIKEK